MMSDETIGQILARRFGIDPPATLIAREGTKGAVSFTRLRSQTPHRGRSLDVPGEEAFAFQVPLVPNFFSGVWYGGKRQRLPVATRGAVYLFDLGNNPVVELEEPFDTLRLHISQSTLDEMAYEKGLRRIGGLKAKAAGEKDLILYGMAQVLAAALEQPEEVSMMFTDYIALAFHEHVIGLYGNAPVARSTPRGGLAPWQLRRAHEFISANLGRDTSIDQLANETGLSSSHFARAFKQTVGVAPHQWLLQKRIDRAKELLRRTDMELSEIALSCGFGDQSHFTRVFTRLERSTPGKWRRLLLE
jgi:AraC family transcriptional regulator